MRIVWFLVAVAIVVGILKDILFGVTNNGLTLVVWVAMILAVVRLAIVMGRSDLERNRQERNR